MGHIHSGERAGSGVPDIYSVWQEQGWEEPVVEERYGPDRTILTLSLVKKQAIKTSDKKTSDKKQAIKTLKNQQTIRLYLQDCEEAKASDIAQHIGLSTARTRNILAQMHDIESLGGNKNRTYKLSEDTQSQRK